MKYKKGRKATKRSSFSKRIPQKSSKIGKGNKQSKGSLKGKNSGKHDKKDRRSTPVPLTPTISHKQQNKLDRQQRKQKERINKLVIEQELKKTNPDFDKINSHLFEIKSRGLRQRIRLRISKVSGKQ